MTKKPPLEGLRPDSVELTDEQLLSLHGCISEIAEKGCDCANQTCNPGAVVYAMNSFGHPFPVCARCLLLYVRTYWDIIYDSRKELNEALTKIEKSLDPNSKYVRPPDDAKPLSTPSNFVPKWDDGELVKDW